MKFGNAIDLLEYIKEKIQDNLNKVNVVLLASDGLSEIQKESKFPITCGLFPRHGKFEQEDGVEIERIVFWIVVLNTNWRAPHASYVGKVSSGALQIAMRIKEILDDIAPIGNLRALKTVSWTADTQTEDIIACRLETVAELARPLKNTDIKEDYFYE